MSRIKVFARVRPSKRPSGFFTFQDEHNQLKFDVPLKEEGGLVNNSKSEYIFKFDGLLPMNVSQEKVFTMVAKPAVLRYAQPCTLQWCLPERWFCTLVWRALIAAALWCQHSAIDGFNSTLFAYGQTGSGKTFTITGGAERYNDRGIIPRSLSYMFNEFQKVCYCFRSLAKAVGVSVYAYTLLVSDDPCDTTLFRVGVCGPQRTDTQFTAYISYLELYNEQGYDLLDPSHETKSLEELPCVPGHTTAVLFPLAATNCVHGMTRVARREQPRSNHGGRRWQHPPPQPVDAPSFVRGRGFELAVFGVFCCLFAWVAHRVRTNTGCVCVWVWRVCVGVSAGNADTFPQHNRATPIERSAKHP